jgi:hypothetical protein
MRQPMVMRSRATNGRSATKCQGKQPDQADRLPSGRVEWWQQSAPRAGLVGRPEKRKYSRRFGVHLGNVGLDGFAVLGRSPRQSSARQLAASSLAAAAPTPPGPRRRAADERDKLAASHSSNSSARMSRDKGTSIPSVLAVCRLTSNSTLAGCSTGRSAGLVPLRTRST